MTVDDALSSPFLWEVRDQGSKSEIFPPTSLSFEFDFERSSASKGDLKALIQLVRLFCIDLDCFLFFTFTKLF